MGNPGLLSSAIRCCRSANHRGAPDIVVVDAHQLADGSVGCQRRRVDDEGAAAPRDRAVGGRSGSAHREIVGDAGFVPLASPDEVDGVVRAIERLQRMPRADREKIADRCRALVADRFSVRAMNRQYERVYLDVARRQGDRENRIQTRGRRPRRDEISSYGEVGRRRSRPEGCA